MNVYSLRNAHMFNSTNINPLKCACYYINCYINWIYKDESEKTFKIEKFLKSMIYITSIFIHTSSLIFL